MSKGAYTYEPGNITEFGKDRMRFELGDTMVEAVSYTHLTLPTILLV